MCVYWYFILKMIVTGLGGGGGLLVLNLNNGFHRIKDVEDGDSTEGDDD